LLGRPRHDTVRTGQASGALCLSRTVIRRVQRKTDRSFLELEQHLPLIPTTILSHTRSIDIAASNENKKRRPTEGQGLWQRPAEQPPASFRAIIAGGPVPEYAHTCPRCTCAAHWRCRWGKNSCTPLKGPCSRPGPQSLRDDSWSTQQAWRRIRDGGGPGAWGWQPPLASSLFEHLILSKHPWKDRRSSIGPIGGHKEFTCLLAHGSGHDGAPSPSQWSRGRWIFSEHYRLGDDAAPHSSASATLFAATPRDKRTLGRPRWARHSTANPSEVDVPLWRGEGRERASAP
jgi:hypothetical protein